MDANEWIRMMTLAKQHGINHYRFSGMVPPEAAFQAADALGIYMQPELYNSTGYDMSADSNTEVYCKAEGKRVLERLGNHPSFVMFATGNELFGGRSARASIVSYWRSVDPSRLYAQASNYEFDYPSLASGDDYWTTMRTNKGSVRGSFAHINPPLGHIQTGPANTLHDYASAISGISVPVVGHEIGQFMMSPNFDEARKYTGAQKAWNISVYQQRLTAAGMFDKWRDFLKASGALAILCYREDIEAALRTPGFGGFQIFDLQDFPYGGTAYVGLFDAFMQSKGLIAPDQWKQFCCEIVPMLKFSKYTWVNNETFSGQAVAANYGTGTLSSVKPVWTLTSGNGTIAAQGSLSVQNVELGVNSLGSISISLANLASPQKYTLNISIENTSYKNSYSIWVYPSQVSTDAGAIIVSNQWNDSLLTELNAGKTVLYTPSTGQLTSSNSVEGFWAANFCTWPALGDTAPGTLGILCDPNHAVFASFPTDFYSNWQWFDLVNKSRSVILDSLPQDYYPVVQVIDNFNRNHKLGLIFEGKVGTGNLLVCGIDLTTVTTKPEGKQLLHSILEYMKSSSFSPGFRFTMQSGSFGILSSTKLPLDNDFDSDGKVSFGDLAIFIISWLECGLDPQSACAK
jgi:hypothetical protein